MKVRPLLISPAAIRQRAGVGTSPEMASLAAERGPSADHRDGCRGFTGPFPPPLWMSNMKLLRHIVTDSLSRLQDHRGRSAGPGRPAALISPSGRCDCAAPDPGGGQPGAGLFPRGTTTAAVGQPGRWRPGLRSVLGGQPSGPAVGLRGAERRGPGGRPRGPWRHAQPGRKPGRQRRRLRRADARHPGRDLQPRLQHGGQLGPVVRPPHALRHCPTSRSSGWRSARDWEAYREYNLAFARALASGPGDAGRERLGSARAPSCRTIT